MSSERLRRRYFDIQRSGMSVSTCEAKRLAIMLIQWEALEYRGYVRIQCPADLCFDGVDLGPSDGSGHGLLGEYTLDPDATDVVWVEADSAWGFVGYCDVANWHENPYVFDVMEATLAAFRVAHRTAVHVRAARVMCG